MKKPSLLLRLAFASLLCAIPVAKADDNLITNSPAATGLAQEAQDKLQQAQTLQDYEQAAALFKQAIKASPDDYDMRLTLGWIYLDKLHDPEIAYWYLNTVVKHSPNDVNARKLLGLAAVQTGRSGKAVEEFREASRLQPHDLWIKAYWGRSLARVGNYGGANRIFDEVLKQDSNNADARLGKAEVAAWEGRSEAALDILRSLNTDNPTNAEVLTLMGDIHRWKWKLSKAKEDYKAALATQTNDVAAQDGLEQAKIAGSSEIAGNVYYFQDTSDFTRESAGGTARVALADRAYLIGSGSEWRFNSPGFNNIFRTDASAGLEYHWARWLETSASGTLFDYSDRDTVWGGQVSAKMTPMTGVDIYTVLAGQQPFVSSIANVTNGLKQNSVGNGLDVKIYGPISFQNSFQAARLSDGNKWWEDKPQVSWHVFHFPDTFLRVQYDYLSFSHTNAFYWTPHKFDTISPVLDISLPIFKNLKIVLNGQAPYVIEASQWGYIFSGGPELDLFNRIHISASYYQSFIPQDQGAWSGKGGQGSISFRF